MFSTTFANLPICIFVVVLTVLPACGRVLAQPGRAGCGVAHSTGQSTDASIISANRKRQFRIHVPSSYNPNVPAPLLLSFHGATKTMADQEQITRFSNDSVNPSMIAVYPQGLVAKGVGVCLNPVTRLGRVLSPISRLHGKERHTTRTCRATKSSSRT